MTHAITTDASLLTINHDAVHKENLSASLSIDDSGCDRINIEINETLKKPLVLSINATSRLTIMVKSGAVAHIVVENSASSHVTMRLAKDARVLLYIIPGQHNHTEITQSLAFHLEEASHLRMFEFGLFEEKCSRAMNVEMWGTGAHTYYFGLDQLHGSAKKNSRLTIFHRVENTTSAQAFRGIYAESAKGIFFGNVVIDKDARLSNAKQLYKSIILGAHATAQVMPQLEINNNDISASHGASIGELDANCLFYLCSRGFSLKDAKAMLMRSLLNNILDHIEEPSIKNSLSLMVERSIARSFSGQS